MAPRVHAANAPILERMLKATGAIGSDNFGESEHPVFRGTSPLARETLKKGEGAAKVSIHFNAEPQTARIVIPHNAWRQSAQDPRSSGMWV